MSDSRGPQPPDEQPEFGEDPEHTEDELSSVVFDEHFVRAASIHEPSAAERQLTGAPPTPSATATPQPMPFDFAEDPYRLHEPRAEGGFRPSGDPGGSGYDDGGDGPVARTAWWRQSVAWVLALLMGMGVVAMAVTAVTPGRSGESPRGPRPTVGTPVPMIPKVDTGHPSSVVSASPAAEILTCVGPLRTGC